MRCSKVISIFGYSIDVETSPFIGSNAYRDFFRFVRLPLDVAYVDTVVRTSPLSEETKPAKLGMWDPHELLDWLYRTGRLNVSKEEVMKLDYL